MQNTIKILVDLKKEIYRFDQAQQGDDVILDLTILENGVAKDLTGETVELIYINANNTVASVTGDKIVVNGNNVKITCPTDCTRSYGIAKFQLKIVSTYQVSTFPIALTIVPSVDQNQQISQNISTILEDLTAKNIECGETLDSLKAWISTGNLLNADLEGNIGTGTILNTDLEGNITTVIELKTVLTNVIDTGNALDTSLEEKISVGNPLDAALKANTEIANTAAINLENVIDTADLTTYASQGQMQEVNSQLADIAKQITTQNGGDCTQDLINCINEVLEGGKILFPQGKFFKIGSIPKITKNVTIDFNSCILETATNNDVFILGFTGETQFNNRIKLLNYTFTKSAIFKPNTIIKIDDAINTELRGNFRSANASHSLIHNYKGYGTKIIGEFRYTECPRNIYLSSSSSQAHSFDIFIDVDITGASGVGIECEGGTGSINGVIEGCIGGGILYNGVHIIQAHEVSIHCEQNINFDIKIGTDVTDATGGSNQGNITIRNSLLGVNSLNVDVNFKAIRYGSGYNINIDTCTIAPNTGVVPLSENSKNNNIFFKGRKTNLIVDETKNNIFIMDWDGVKFTKDFQCGVATAKSVTTSKITSTDSTNGLSIFLPNNVQLYFKQNAFLPPQDYSMGGRWNLLTNIYAKNISLQSPDGNVWSISVNNSGVITAIKV